LKILGYDFKVEKRSGESSLKNPQAWLASLMGRATAAGETVNPTTALSLSAVYSATSIIANTIASLPCQVYKTTEGNRAPVSVHPLNFILRDEPNRNMTAFIFFQTLQTSVLLWGNAYARIHRDEAGRPHTLEYLHPSSVTPTLYQGELFYKIDGQKETVNNFDMLHVPGLGFTGLVGKGVIEVAAENIGLGLAAQSYGSEFFANGGNLAATLETDSKLTDEAFERLQTSWYDNNGAKGKRAGTKILEQGLKYKPVTIPPEQAQFILTKKITVTDIARYFGLPPHLIADLERSTNNNIEHQGIEFVQHCIRPWVKRWEQELDRKLFRDDEKGMFAIKFNLNSLLRGDVKSRGEYYSKLFSVGALSQNDIRRLENQNDIDGGDRYFVQNTMIPVDMVDKQKQFQHEETSK
jgi:HK97 family phage portal protein